ncbi:unnamed protein product [Rotaria sp. Silwood2]|nr:unnamed protein product [Rotaria sp. Silwood2]
MMRDITGSTNYFGLDEIKIYDQPCDSGITTTTTEPPITESTTTTTETLTTESTTTTTETPATESTTTTTETPTPESTTTTTKTSNTESTTTTTEIPTTKSTTVTSEKSTTESMTTTTSLPGTSTFTSTTTTSLLPKTTTTVRTSTISITTTVSTTLDHFESSLITQGIEESSSSNVPIITTTTTTSTTQEPLIPIFTCDFSMTSCFGGSELLITNGNEFSPVDISSESPRAPLSDVSSINEPTNNNEICKLPYRPSIDNSTNATSWDMWFCYKNQCPTESQQSSNCKLGNYGLISIDAWESNKTIVKSISQDEMIRNSVREQCLQYYYYFTVYDKFDWGQQISVLIKSENETDDENEIDRLSIVDILENRWHPRNITFNSTYANYTLMFHFEVTNDNRTNDPTLNKTIYFALDNIELYNGNCRSVIKPPTSPTTSSQSLTTTTTREADELTATSPSES